MEPALMNDAAALMRDFFVAAKLSNKSWYKKLASNDEVCYAFFTVRRRMIQAKKYIVHESNKINIEKLKPEAARDYLLLKQMWETKGDLKKFHTENSKILFPIDGLLENYGINHLHIDRSRFQVFFVEKDGEIFVLNICSHFGKSRMSYHKESLLETLRHNWPSPETEPKSKRHPKAEGNYVSSYGWHKTDTFKKWLSAAEKAADSQHLTLLFEENEHFMVVDGKEKNPLPGILPFIV